MRRPGNQRSLIWVGVYFLVCWFVCLSSHRWSLVEGQLWNSGAVTFMIGKFLLWLRVYGCEHFIILIRQERVITWPSLFQTTWKYSRSSSYRRKTRRDKLGCNIFTIFFLFLETNKQIFWPCQTKMLLRCPNMMYQWLRPTKFRGADIICFCTKCFFFFSAFLFIESFPADTFICTVLA